MNIKIKLKDNKKCNGCPLLINNWEFFYNYCSIGYNIKYKENEGLIRPKKCIKENGN